MTEVTCPYCDQTFEADVEPEDETHLCGAPTQDDGTCSVEVNGPNENCWRHE